MDDESDNDISVKIRDRINKSYEKLYIKDEDGKFQPYICVVCDRILKHNDVNIASIRLLTLNQDILEEKPEMNLCKGITQCYKISPNNQFNDSQDLKQMLLSPRSTLIKNGRLEGYTCCESCLHGLHRNKMPKYAIANGYYFGTAPKVLTDLTMVERAMLTPVKTWGYCFTYSGGQKSALEGNMTYYNTAQFQMKGNLHYQGRSHESIAKVMAQFEAMGLNNDIVVILHGWMTPAQKKAAQKHNQVRVSKLIDAIRWLIANNTEWMKRDIDLEKMKDDLEHPLIIDRSKEVEPSSEKEFKNIEESETFHVFFPDGTMTSVNGGQESMEVFREIIKEKKSAGFQASVQCDLHNKYVYDYKDNNLVNTCLLQFPYGRGGLQERRLRGDGTAIESTDIDEYVCHLSRISQKYFHEELFCLILYNLSIKNMMLRTASWKVRGGTNSEMIGKDLTREAVEMALNDKKESRFASRNRKTPGHTYVGAIDTTTGTVPHTNEAAYQARKTAEAIQFEYGQPSWFLTVTPDDDNAFIIQVYSQTDIDLTSIDITNLTDDELMEKAQKRTSLRMKFPGISALFFEEALDIVIQDVIGWNINRKEAISDNGLFGNTRAFTATVEEQGRGTLHVHMLIWVDSFLELQESLHHPVKRIADEAKQKIADSIDAIASTKLIGDNSEQKNLTPHQCTGSTRIRNDITTTKVCSDSNLRCMRHQKAYKEYIQKFATCQLCNQSWSDMDILRSYMVHVKGVDGLLEGTDMLSRMKAFIVHYQMGTRPLDEEVVHAAYDKHIHTKSCFRSEKIQHAKRSIECCLRDYECRYRFPRRKKAKTEITPVFKKLIPWYMWDGSYVDREIHEINERRSSFDAFQNVSCTAITTSKLTCNTNISALLPSPATYYAFKYNTKGTQTDDEACYDRVLEATKRSLAQAMPDKSLYAIAISRLLRASFAHQKTNVIRGTLASFLTRKKSRFVFSHSTVWCPISDLKHVIKNENAFSTIQYAGRTPFFECSALNYICRPYELENVSPHDFYSEYEVVRMTKKTMESRQFLSFVNIPGRNHPSYSNDTDKFFKCIVKREKRCLVKFSAYLFPDTAQFEGSLLDPKLEINPTTEMYCETVLVLFHSYRCIEDIQIQGSFQRKLMQIVQTTGLPETTTRKLQNILNFSANMLRYKSNEDDLQRVADPYKPNMELTNHQTEVDGQQRDDEINSMELEEMMIHLDQCDEDCNFRLDNARQIPHHCNLQDIRGYGKHRCGYDHIALMTDPSREGHFIFNQTIQETIMDTNTLHSNDMEVENNKHIFEEKDFVKIVLTKISRRTPTVESELNKRISKPRLEANGSVESIIDWAIIANLDSRQKRAFEIFTATYIMTFYVDAIHNPEFNDITFIKEKSNLQLLLEHENCNDMQLICFLHGPAGCGKTTVVDLFLDYAREFSSFLPGFHFDSNTIRVTAMSGTAATLIGGETTHSALYLNQKQQIRPEQIMEWRDTRMVIVDEISFASDKQIKLIQQRLAFLKQKRNLPYGGIHIIFTGDMRQLEPCKPTGQPVYDDYCVEFHEWVNKYITLDGKYRFQDDPEWGEILGRFRAGTVTSADIEKINNRVVKKQKIPENIRYATYYNKCRDAINAALFEKFCTATRDDNMKARQSIVIFSDNIKIRNQNKAYVDLTNCQHFWQTCGEQHVDGSGFHGKIDPVLRLYTGCRVMFPYNKDVSAGLANGTQGYVKRVHIKYGTPVRYIKLNDNTKVRAVFASEVKSIDILHVNKRIVPSIFSVEPEDYTVKVKMLLPKSLRSKPNARETVMIKCKQIPLVINNATTGHKLQGVGVDTLFVHEWLYGSNWPYVVLSRVRTINGLYLRKKLKAKLSTYDMSPALKRMLDCFVGKEPTYWTESEYNEIFPSINT